MFAFADAVVDDAAARDPIFATQGGIPGHDHQLSDFSAEAAHANLAAQREARRRLDTLPLADEADRLAHAVMAERLDASVELGVARGPPGGGPRGGRGSASPGPRHRRASRDPRAG